jgi:hypothetical protein
MSNLETVQDIYGAFGRGDIPFILDKVSESAEWDYGSTSDVPWLMARKGRQGAADFFEALGGFEISKFVPHTFLDGGDVVVVMVDIESKAASTGLPIAEEDEVHIWRFDEDGKVNRFAHKVDSHAHWKAYHGK